MNVISLSHVNLVRARREMERAYLNDDWDQVKDWDLLIGEQLNAAFDDPARDNCLLLGELENILELYAQMVDVLPFTGGAQRDKHPELVQ